MILLLTDFGLAGPYVGQMKTVLAAAAPGVPVIDLMHDAPAFRPGPAGQLLAALLAAAPAPAVWLCVVDPGVGTDRRPLAIRCGEHWLVGPDNGLFAPVLRGAAAWRAWAIGWRPDWLSASFHGRDLFAPVAARLACGAEATDPAIAGVPVGADRLVMPPAEPAQVIYVDGFGNAMTGLRAADLSEGAVLAADGRPVPRARTFGAVPAGAAFWYENSLGLAEIAVNQGSAAATLGLDIGAPVAIMVH